MVADIDSSLEVMLDLCLDHIAPEKNGVIRRTVHQDLLHQGPETASQPIMHWDVESDLLSLKNGSWKFVAHQFLQKDLLA